MTQPGNGAAPDPTRLDGLVFLVTGAGSGIGAATAELLGRRGARVAATDLDADAATATAQRIVCAGGEALGLAADVTSERRVAAAYDRTLERFGDLDGAVNCAGTILARPLHETSGEEWDRIMSVNATGVFHSSKHAVLRLLGLGHGGALVTIGSISAVVGLTEQAAYCASKGAVLQLSRQIAVDYAHRGIRSNVVGPGSVHTRILDAYLEGRDDPAAAEREAVAAHPLGRLGEPPEIAEAAVFLASPAASFITGANLQADGGYTAV